MGRESIKEKAEAWMMQAARSQGTLPPEIQIVHAESGEHAQSERIIVEATVSEELLEVRQALPGGEIIQGFNVEIEIELRSTNRNAAQIDDIFAAIERALFNPDCVTFAKEMFNLLEFFPERMSVAGSRGRNTRNRSRKFPFVLSEKNLAPAVSR